ncbi:MAG: hypothetical protein KGH79_04880 [Patescibacteria group bacterium]|nr:hypothetical protein [Patescibacteria group bacterium]
MRRHTLQEWAKFAAGVIAADFFFLLWFSQVGAFPVDFYGMSLTADMVLPSLIFDIAVFLILVHYGWNLGKIPHLRERSYLMVAGIIFTIVALAHLWRLFSSASLVIVGWEVPLWLSWFGVMITAYLAYTSFYFAMRLRKN